MGLKRSHLRPSNEPLYGFTGDSIIPLGLIILPFMLGEQGRKATTMTDFLIIDCSTAYNTVLRRPAFNDLEVITSTKHLTLKFPTLMGVGHVYGEQNVAKSCYEKMIRFGTRKKAAKAKALTAAFPNASNAPTGYAQ
ncbi:hypothetical protein ACOSP7_003357 [Xanthoceras sorbifolium]